MVAPTDEQREARENRVWIGSFVLLMAGVGTYLLGAYLPPNPSWAPSFYFGIAGGLFTSAVVLIVERTYIDR